MNIHNATAMQHHNSFWYSIAKVDANSVIKLCSFLIVFGLALAHFTGSQPYEALLQGAQTAQLVAGVILFLYSWLFLFKFEGLANSKFRYMLLLGPVILAFSSLCAYINSGYVLEQLVEHAIKIGVPSLFAFTFIKKLNERTLINFLKWLTACTFIGHAIFALGLNYVPENFMAMTQAILLLSPSQSVDFLFVMGVLDIIFALLVFTNGKTRRIALYYLVIWGLATSLARAIYPFCSGDLSSSSISNGFLGMVYRLPHGLIPFFLLGYYKKYK